MKYSSCKPSKGKTSSAQYDDSDRYHSWFTGFAPYESIPDSSMCDSGRGYSGVSSAAQVVAKLCLIHILAIDIEVVKCIILFSDWCSPVMRNIDECCAISLK